MQLGFACKVLAVPVAYGALFGCFAGELFAFEAEFDAFLVGAVADGAEFVWSGYAACFSVGAASCLHFGAFFTCDSTYAYSHLITSALLMLYVLFKPLNPKKPASI
jgi:hypothetical protein